MVKEDSYHPASPGVANIAAGSVRLFKYIDPDEACYYFYNKIYEAFDGQISKLVTTPNVSKCYDQT